MTEQSMVALKTPHALLSISKLIVDDAGDLSDNDNNQPDDSRTMMISCVSHFPFLLSVAVAFAGTMLLPEFYGS